MGDGEDKKEWERTACPPEDLKKKEELQTYQTISLRITKKRIPTPIICSNRAQPPHALTIISQ